MSRVLITGTSSSGKSSVFDRIAFDEWDYEKVNEIAREWLGLFNSQDLYKSFDRSFLQQLIEVNHIKNWVYNDHALFDRGLPDELAYRKFFNMDIPDSLIENCNKFRYDKIFYFPYWDEIYMNDDIRKETKEEAQQIDFLIREAYESLDYELIEVPKLSIHDRIQFLHENL